MTQETLTTALGWMKTRLNRLQGDTSLDTYFTARLQAAEQELNRIGVRLTDTVEDTVFLADFAVWQYQNRDQPGAMPDWLRLRRRERWLNESGEAVSDDP